MADQSLSDGECLKERMMPATGKPETDHEPGKGLLGWLGRQIGYVKRAVVHDVTNDVTPPSELARIYQQKRVEEQTLPDQPHVTLRRTTIDEVVVKPPSKQ